jgi:membrane protease YdiL (CAAX protease family)
VALAILLSLAAAAAALALAAPLVLLTGLEPPIPEPLDARTFTSVALATDAALLVVALLVLPRNGTVRFTLPERWLRPTAAAFVGVSLVNALGTLLISATGEPYAGFPAIGADAWGAVALLAAVVVAPFSEELFFREALLARILGPAPRALGVALSSALFGAFHIGSGGAILVGTLCLMGAILGDLRLRTGSLGPAILLHALNNGIALLVAVLAGP